MCVTGGKGTCSVTATSVLRFNVDCGAAVGQYSAVKGAFGGGEYEETQCPAPAPGLDCVGALSNCWSPGQRDTDCPNNGLCW